MHGLETQREIEYLLALIIQGSQRGMHVVVMKFGGSSVGDAKSMSAVMRLIEREHHRAPVVVLSAIVGAAETLLHSASLALEGNLDDATINLNRLLERHVSLVENLIDDRPVIQQLIFAIRRRFEELRSFCQGISMLGEFTPRTSDAIASAGELLSSLILTEALRLRKQEVVCVDARTFIVTDEQFTSALPLMDTTKEKVEAVLVPALRKGQIVVTQASIGATPKGITTTLGPGGSDLSASIIGAALDAEEIQIWTDLDGILTADPRLAPRAQRLRVLSFQEASELAYFSAHVLHPTSILPAVAKKIPVTILDSKRSASNGTRILAETPRTAARVKSIASKRGIIVINIQSSRMLMAYGFLESIFSVFARHRTSVDLVCTSEVALSLTIDSGDRLGDIVADLRRFGEVTVIEAKAIVCVVGEQLHSSDGIVARIFCAMGELHMLMVCQGNSGNNVSIVVDDTDVAEAVQRLHKEFFEPLPSPELFEPLGGG